MPVKSQKREPQFRQLFPCFIKEALKQERVTDPLVKNHRKKISFSHTIICGHSKYVRRGEPLLLYELSVQVNLFFEMRYVLMIC